MWITSFLINFGRKKSRGFIAKTSAENQGLLPYFVGI